MIDAVYDASSLFGRSWYAAQKNISDDPAEVLSLMLRTVILLLNPGSFSKIGAHFDRTLFAWDGKQNPLKKREEKPPRYHDTKSIAQDILALVLGAANYQHPDYEGDDVVATAVFAAKPGDITYIFSGDKDLQALQGPRCPYYCLNTKALLSRQYINHKWHIQRPAQIALVLAIIGDPVDCIKGVRGYGPKKCKQMFKAVTPEMNFTEALHALAEQVPASKLEEFYAALDRTLLQTSVPGVPPPAPLKLADPAEVRRTGIPNVYKLYCEMFEAYESSATTKTS